MMIRSMQGRLCNMVDGRQDEIFDDLNLEDDETTGTLHFDKIMNYWKYTGLPELDEEMEEFLAMMALRVSNSLAEVNYKKLCKVFDQEFELEPSAYEDETPFKAT